MLKVFRPRGSLYPGDVIIDSSVDARDVAAVSSKTSDPNYIVHAVVIVIINGEWSSTVTLKHNKCIPLIYFCL